MNATCNGVTNGVTPSVTNGVCTTVQNQNQNQTVVKGSCGWSMASQVQIVKAVDARGVRRIGLGD